MKFRGRIILGFSLIVGVFLVLSLVIFIQNSNALNTAHEVESDDVPGVIRYLQVLDEVGDMQSNVLEYMVGESDEVVNFEENYGEFKTFYELLRSLESGTAADIAKMDQIKKYVEDYVTGVRTQVFGIYNPDNEAWAIDAVDKMENSTGAELEDLLDQLKDEEYQDALKSTDLEESIADDLPGVRLYLEIMDEAGDMLSNLTEYLLGEIDEEESFYSNSASFMAYLDQLRPLERKPREVASLARIEELHNEILRVGGEVFDRYDPSNKASAIKTVDDLEHNIFEPLEEILDSSSQEEVQDATTALAKLGSTMTLINTSLIISIIATVIISIIIIYLITMNLMRKLGGEPADLVSVNSRISKGDLTVELNLREGDQKSLTATMNQMVNQLKEIVSNVQLSSSRVTSSSQEMSATAQSLSEGSTEQAASAEEVSSSMEEMSANIQQNAENASQTEKIALKVSAEAQESGAAVDEAVVAMNQIADKISIIEEIARNTNLLALNAAIEAARAGDHGKGFAVVAAEVRKLAERSQKAAAEINSLASSSVQVAERAGTLLTSLVPNVKKTAELVQEISAASMEQNNGVDQINQALLQLDKVTQQNASSAEEMAATSNELAGQARDLTQLMSFFNIGRESVNIKGETKNVTPQINGVRPRHINDQITDQVKPPLGEKKYLPEQEVYDSEGGGDDYDNDFAEF